MPILGITASAVVAAYKMVVATIGSRIFTSYNGTDISYGNTPSSYKVEAVNGTWVSANAATYKGGTIANAQNFISYTSALYYQSTDGVTWSSGILPNTVGSIMDMKYNSNLGKTVLLQGSTSPRAIYESTDLITWTTTVTGIANTTYKAILQDNNTYIAQQSGKLVSWISSGGTWVTLSSTTLSQTVNEMLYVNDGNIYTVGYAPHIAKVQHVGGTMSWTTFADYPGGIGGAGVSNVQVMSIKYGNGRYVAPYLDTSEDAIGAVSSTDGVTWVSAWIGAGAALPGSAVSVSNCFAFEFYNGLFYSAGYDVNTDSIAIFTSLDGITWIPGNSFSSYLPSSGADADAMGSIVFKDNVALAVYNPSAGSSQLYLSSQANTISPSIATTSLSWITTSLASSSSIADEDYNTGWYDKYLNSPIRHFSTSTTDYLAYSNGLSWVTIMSRDISNMFGTYLYNGSRHVVVFQKASDQPIYSTDGIYWLTASGYTGAHSVSTNLPASTVKAAASSTHFIVGSRGSGSTGGTRMVISTDGAVWTSLSLPGVTWGFSTEPIDVIYANGFWTILLENGRVYTSTDTTTWTSSAPGLTLSDTVSRKNGLVSDNSYIYAISRSSTAGLAVPMFRSTDAITWTTYASAAYGSFRDIVKAGDTWYSSVTNSGKLYVSTDATTWTSVGVGADTFIDSTYSSLFTDGKDLFFVGADGLVKQAEVSSQNQLTGFNVKDILYTPKETSGLSKDTYLLSGKNLLKANEAMSWTSVINSAVFGKYGANKAEFVNSKFYVGGAGSRVIYSTDSISWSPMKSHSVKDLVPIDQAINPTPTVGISYANSTLGIATASRFMDTVQDSRLFRYRSGYEDTDTLQEIQSYNFTVWTTSAVASIAMQDLTYLDHQKLWVSNGNSGVIKYSTDLITWTTVTTSQLGTNNTTKAKIIGGPQRVKYIYVAGDSGRIVRSTNGIAWATATSAATTAHVNRFAVSDDGVIVAAAGVAVQGVAHYVRSTDGTTWTTGLISAAGTNVRTGSIDYGPSYPNGPKVFAVLTGTAAVPIIKKSTDGITWTTTTAAGGTTESIAYSKNINQWVASNGSDFKASTDLTTWVTLISSVGGANNQINEVPGYILLTSGSALTYGKYSTNGVTWTTFYLPTSSSFRGIDVDTTNKTIAMMDNVTTAYRTSLTWITNVTSLSTNTDGTKHIIVASGTPLRSSDMVDWTDYAYTSGAIVNARKIKYLGGLFIGAGGNGKSYIYKSTNGSAWTSSQPSTVANSDGSSIAYDGTTYVATIDSGGTANSIYYSTNLTAWTTITLATTPGQVNDIHYDVDKFVSVTSTGKVFYSTNGTTGWTAGTSNTASALYFVNNQNELGTGTGWIASGIVFRTSTNGVTWTTRSAPTAGFWGASADAIGRFIWKNQLVLVDGTDNLFALTTDGITWDTTSIVVANKNYPAIDNAFAAGNKIFSVDKTTNPTMTLLEYTTDGTTWVSVSASWSSAINASVYGGGIYVGHNAGIGSASNSSSTTVRSVNPGFIAPQVNDHANGIYVGNEGIYSDSSTYGGLQRLVSGVFSHISYNAKNGYVATGNSAIYKSTDGVVWTSTSISTAGQFSIGGV
jgi:hypothetical protein